MSTATAPATSARDDAHGITMTFEVRQERRYGYYDPYKRRGSGWVRHPKKQTPDGPSMAFVFPDGESVMDNLMERHSRPWQVWKPLVEHLLREQGVQFVRLAWRQYYYCDCGCSPGFVVIGTVGPGYDYHFTVS